MKKKMVIITGCGRSGTLYMRKVFEVFGYDIGHEGLRKDGISSWYIVDPHHYNKVDMRINEDKSLMNRKRTYIHLVRNPLDVISSMYRCEKLPNRAALNFFRRSMPQYANLSPISIIAKYWVEWNLSAEKSFNFDVCLRVEDIRKPKTIRKLFELIEMPVDVQLFGKIFDLGTNVHTLKPCLIDDLVKTGDKKAIEGITLSDIAKESWPIAQEIINLAEKYNYHFNPDKELTKC